LAACSPDLLSVAAGADRTFSLNSDLAERRVSAPESNRDSELQLDTLRFIILPCRALTQR
jgi:hypothetical protein